MFTLSDETKELLSNNIGIKYDLQLWKKLIKK